MRKIIVIIIVAMISSFSYYGAVNEKREKVVDFTEVNQKYWTKILKYGGSPVCLNIHLILNLKQ